MKTRMVQIDVNAVLDDERTAQSPGGMLAAIKEQLPPDAPNEVVLSAMLMIMKMVSERFPDDPGSSDVTKVSAAIQAALDGDTGALELLNRTNNLH